MHFWHWSKVTQSGSYQAGFGFSKNASFWQIWQTNHEISESLTCSKRSYPAGSGSRNASLLVGATSIIVWNCCVLRCFAAFFTLDTCYSTVISICSFRWTVSGSVRQLVRYYPFSDATNALHPPSAEHDGMAWKVRLINRRRASNFFSLASIHTVTGW